MPASKSPIGVMLSWSTVGLLRKAASLVLDRVRRFRPIPIYWFFAVSRIRYRYDTDFFIRFKSGRGTAWLTDQRFLRSDKRDRSSTWRSANSTRSVVGLCSCCMTLTASAHASSFNCRMRRSGPLDVLGTGVTDSQLLSPSLPPFAGRGNDCMHRQCSRDVRMRTIP